MLVALELRRKKHSTMKILFVLLSFFIIAAEKVQKNFLLSFFTIAAEKVQKFSRFREGGCGG